MKLRHSNLISFVAVWGVAGFPLLAAITAALGVSNSLPSIATRAIVLLISISLLITRNNSNFAGTVRSPIVSFFMLFWTLYFGRITLETLFDASTLSQTPLTYWSFGLGASFLPMVALAFSRATVSGRRLYNLTLGGAATALGLSMLNADTLAGLPGEAYETGRLALDTLNPIALGQLGATVLLLVYWRIKTSPSNLFALVLILIGGLGLLGMILSGSRGPLVAFGCAVLFLEVSSDRGRGVARILIGLTLLTSIYYLGLLPGSETSGLRTLARFEEAFNMSDPAALMRLKSFGGAWAQFLENPILGSGLEERSTQFYPHNIFLEAFMATGALGGLALMAGIFLMIGRSYALIRQKHPLSWSAVLYIQYLSAAQFSGAIYNISAFWTLAGLVIATTSRAPTKANAT